MEPGVGRIADFVAATEPGSLGSTLGRGARQLAARGQLHERPASPRTRTPSRTGDSTGGFDVVALGTGLRVFNSLRLGGTLNRWFNGYTQRYHPRAARGPDPGPRGPVYEYELSGWNANVGVIWAPFDSLNLGAVGKTPFTADVSLGRERTDFSPSTSAFTGTARAQRRRAARPAGRVRGRRLLAARSGSSRFPRTTRGRSGPGPASGTSSPWPRRRTARSRPRRRTAATSSRCCRIRPSP